MSNDRITNIIQNVEKKLAEDNSEIQEIIDYEEDEDITEATDEEFLPAERDVTFDSNGKKIYSITELSKILGKSTSTLRHWEKEVKDLIVVTRGPQGARFYTEKDIKMFKLINHYREQNLPLGNIYTFLKHQMEGGEGEVPFSTPDFTNDAYKNLEKILVDFLDKRGSALLLESGTSQEQLREEERREHIKRETAKRKVESKLRSSALKEWMKEPVEKRFIKAGLFKKEENITARDLFVEEYIGENFEIEYEKEMNKN